jgi:hypothetical protein
VLNERQTEGYRFGVLLVALVSMLVWGACVDLLSPGVQPLLSQLFLGLVLTGMLLSAVYAVSSRDRSPLIALLLALPALVLGVTDVAIGGRVAWLAAAGHVTTTVFLLYTAGILLQSIFRCRRVTTNTIFASLCVYLILGVVWSLVYLLIEQLQPGSFAYPLAERPQPRLRTETTGVAIYYSFVTMTTLGYGDIVPISRTARSISALQAIAGQMYLTVLVAWLVGLHIAHDQARKE